jgi:penicillin-binding protein 1C
MDRRLVAAAIFLMVPVIFSLIVPTRTQLLTMKYMYSIRIYDRQGTLLREVLSQQDATNQYASIDSISPWLIHATLCSEDKRFFTHPGIDCIALARAGVQNLLHGRIISGGSTITQQLARNMLGSQSRSILYKCMEACFALNIEMKLSKEEILELYFNYAPYGNQTYGIEAASYLYFRKPARDLSLNEAAFLAGIPKASSWYNPYKHPERTEVEAARILKAMYVHGIIDTALYERSLAQKVEIMDREKNFKAPHFCEYVLTMLGAEHYAAPTAVFTTLSYHVQEEIEAILRNNIDRLSDANVTNAAAIVMDRRSMDILAYVGSVDFFDPLIDGEVDGVRALRQPGSALKPFTYAIALEQGAHASTLIPDMPTYESTFGGDYRPRNYDEKYHGMVRLRTALACSYNIPAVRVCGSFGPEMLLDRLHALGFESLNKSPVHYGVGLTLGNGEVMLLELTRAYGTLGHAGQLLPERALHRINERTLPVSKPARTVFTPQVAYIITDIIADNQARSPAFGECSPLNLPFFCAVKTGTSKDFRDNWCIGFTDDFLVGVWVGNFDGSPMHKVSGITGAAPIFRDIMLILHRNRAPVCPLPPPGLVNHTICTISGDIASPQCENCMTEVFIPGNEPMQMCQGHNARSLSNLHATDQSNDQFSPRTFTISFPDDHDIFKIDPILRKEYQCLRMQISTDHALQHVMWYVDDRTIGRATYPFSIMWQLSPGKHKIVAQGITEDNETVRTPAVTITVLK